MHLCACMHFIYSCTLEWHPGATLKRVGLCASPSHCQARWLLSLQEEEERWKEKGKKGGRLELALTELEWPVPRAATSGDHLQLAPSASSLPSSFPMLTFSFHDGGVGGGRESEAVVVGVCLARLCAHAAATFFLYDLGGGGAGKTVAMAT